MAMVFKSRGEPVLFIMDNCDAKWANKYRWYIHGANHQQQCHPKPYTTIKVKGQEKKRYYLARLITQAKPKQYVRYKNGNRLDCRRGNLWLSRSSGGDPHVLPVRSVDDDPLTQV